MRMSDVDWTDKASVIAFAKSLGPGQTVFKVEGRPNYNITHTSRADQWSQGEVIYCT